MEEHNQKGILHKCSCFNELYELGKRDKMLGKPRILSIFRNEYNKFNNTRTRLLDSIYSDIKVSCNLILVLKTLSFFHYVRKVVMDVITFPENL